ncbi:hypothetical protein PG997_014992 [Apiospora hydei]|uniref:2EXR domain-containing protein n=1 Tax=Apiospora hydei TaxID=1337664 RepID=A0ABR1UVD1_9PEZI
MDVFSAFKESLWLFEEEPTVHDSDGNGGAEFKPFPRLPIELRLKIWRATWIPKEVWPKKCLFLAETEYGHIYNQTHGEVSSPPDGSLPVTARVNQESRNETLRMYRKIPSTDCWAFCSFFNQEIDFLRVYSCARRICSSTLNPTHLLGVRRLIIATCFHFNWGAPSTRAGTASGSTSSTLRIVDPST